MPFVESDGYKGSFLNLLTERGGGLGGNEDIELKNIQDLVGRVSGFTVMVRLELGRSPYLLQRE